MKNRKKVVRVIAVICILAMLATFIYSAIAGILSLF